jgi:XTP/dITP diphosphohydrolase
MAALLADLPYRIQDLAEFPGVVLPPEGETSYAENALGKARAVTAATGLPALADDSGIEVDALEGRPGVVSARYGGEGLTDLERNASCYRSSRAFPPPGARPVTGR